MSELQTNESSFIFQNGRFIAREPSSLKLFNKIVQSHSLYAIPYNFHDKRTARFLYSKRHTGDSITILLYDKIGCLSQVQKQLLNKANYDIGGFWLLIALIDRDYSSSIVGWTCSTSFRILLSYCCSSGTWRVDMDVEVEVEVDVEMDMEVEVEEEEEKDEEEEGKEEPCNNCCTVLCSQTLLSGPSVVCLKELRILLR